MSAFRQLPDWLQAHPVAADVALTVLSTAIAIGFAIHADVNPGERTIGGLRLVQVIVPAAVATLVAAWLSARRAGKLDVLDAISHG